MASLLSKVKKSAPKPGDKCVFLASVAFSKALSAEGVFNLMVDTAKNQSCDLDTRLSQNL